MARKDWFRAIVTKACDFVLFCQTLRADKDFSIYINKRAYSLLQKKILEIFMSHSGCSALHGVVKPTNVPHCAPHCATNEIDHRKCLNKFR